jgi:SNF family Na+-dependent transporter
MTSPERMQFSSRMLMVITPVGVGIGLYEAWHFAGKLVFLMALQMLVLLTIVVVVVRIARRESRQKGSSGQ